MSRSRKQPSQFFCYGADPRGGKRRTSREIRRTVRQRIWIELEDFDFAHLMDRTRGRAGSRDKDWGWDWFGDGKTGPYILSRLLPKDEFEKLCRK